MAFGKLLQRGERITVVLRHTHEVVRAVVQSGRREVRARFTRVTKGLPPNDDSMWDGKTLSPPTKHRVTYRVDRASEGVEWVRGWDGEAADALRAATALR